MKVAIVGTGYVGLVSGTCFAEMGNKVICVDNDEKKLEKLNSGIVPIYEPGLETLFTRNIEQKRLAFTNNLKSAVIESEIIFLCLPTPPGEDGSADLKYVFGVAESIGKILQDEKVEDFKIIVDKSTVPVGTARKVKDIIKKYDTKDFDIVSNPEFLREGFAVEDFLKPDRIVFGAESEIAKKKMRTLYEPFVRQGNPIIEMDPYSSEVTKYAANSYLAMRITFMNELANFCEEVGADIDLVRRGMSTDSRIGKRFLFAGIGYGGSCFPKDVKALAKTSIEKQSEMQILSLVDKVNDRQKTVMVDKLLKYYNGNIKGKTFAVWGLAFKPNTDDMREAPSVLIIRKLLEYGAVVKAYDPEAMETAKFYLNETVNYVTDQYSVLENADALLIFTEWNEFRNPNFERLGNALNEKLIFDGRNIFTPQKMKELGFTYYSIGRQPV